MNKPFCLILLIALLAFPAVGQHLYTLQECVEMGLQRNFSIKIAKNKEQMARNNATIGNAGYLPTLNLQSGVSATNNDVRSETQDGTVSTTNAVHNDVTSAALNLSWTLFDGLYIQTNHTKLKELKRQGEVQTRLSIESFIAQITAQYYSFISHARRLKTLRYAVDLSRERLRIVEARYELGDFSRLDLQQARVDFNADSSRWVKQQEAVKTAAYNLNNSMAKENVYDSFKVPSLEVDIDYTLDADRLLQQMLSANSHLLLSAKSKQLSVLELKAAQSRNYPYLKLNAGYGYALNRYEVATNRSQQTLGFNYGVTLGFTVFDGFNRSREQKNARIAIINAENQHQELELDLRTDLATIYTAYRNNISLVQLEEKNLLVAQENYEIAMERYKIGTLSGIELREAQKSLLDAEERLLTSQFDTKLCEISLLQLAGQLPERMLN